MKRFLPNLKFALAFVLLTGLLTVANAWTFVGSPGFTGGAVEAPSTAVDTATGHVYIAFGDGSNSHRLMVMKYDGVAWDTVGQAGISEAHSNNMYATSIVISPDGVPYVAYTDFHNNGCAVRKFDGANWVTLDINNTISTGACYDVRLVFGNDGKPYVAYNDNAVRVKYFDGSGWEYVGGQTQVSTGSALEFDMALDANNHPYVTYGDNLNGQKLTMDYYNGTAWVKVSDATTVKVRSTAVGFSRTGDGPFIAYSDDNSGGGNQLYVKKYDGAVFNDVGTQPVNSNSCAYTNFEWDYSNAMYVEFMGGQTQVMKFNGTVWVNFGCPSVTGGTGILGELAFDKDNVGYTCVMDFDRNFKATVAKNIPGGVTVLQTQPESASLCDDGSNGIFTVVVQNPDMYTSYQWQEDSGSGFTDLIDDWTNYSGSQGSTLNIYDPYAGGRSGNKYRVLVSGCDEPAMSDTALLTVSAIPTIAQSPEPYLICGSGTTAGFGVLVNDTTVTYGWWYHDGNNFINLSDDANHSGTATDSLTFSNVDQSMANYYYCVVTSATGGCTATSGAYLTVDREQRIYPKATSTSVCQGNAITLQVDTVSNVVWSDGVTNYTEFTPTQSKMYYVSGNNYYGCPASDSIFIDVFANTLPVPVITAHGATTFCSGGVVKLTASNVDQFTWSTGEVTESIYVDKSTTATVLSMDGIGCRRRSAPVQVYSPVLPAITLTQAFDCNGGFAIPSAGKPYHIPDEVDMQAVLDDSAYIDAFTFAGIDNPNSGANIAEGTKIYTNYPSTAAHVEPGETYPFAIAPASGNFTSLAYAIYIDLNGDGDFDDIDEMVFTTNNTPFDWTTQPVQSQVTIPIDAAPVATRMRVRTSAYDTFYGGDADWGGQGETEDYVITIGKAAPLQYAWTSNPVGFVVSDQPFPGTEIFPDTTYILTVTDTVSHCSKVSSVVADSATLMPTAYGDHVWNVYGFDGRNRDNYRGFYVDDNLNFNSGNYWSGGDSPSNFWNYKGCVVNQDDFSADFRRKGFEPGVYQVSVIHTGDVQLYINDNKVFEHLQGDHADDTVWTGPLNESSRISYVINEKTADSYAYGQIQMDKILSLPNAGTIIGDEVICGGTTGATFTVNGVSADDFLWTLPAGATITSGDSTSTITVNFSSAASGIMSVRGVNEAGTGAPAYQHITIGDAIENAQNLVICSGESVQIGDSTYTATGFYTNVLTAASGCDSTVMTSLTVNPSPDAQININANILICAGATVTFRVLNPQSGDEYLWSNGSTTSSISPGDSGVYNVMVTNDGCSSGSGDAMITVYPNPLSAIAASGATTFCEGGSVNLSAQESRAVRSTTTGNVALRFDLPATGYTWEMRFKTTRQGSLFTVFNDAQHSYFDRNLFVGDMAISHNISTTGPSETIDGMGKYNDGKWHHVAIVLESGVGQRMYIDGNLIVSGTLDHAEYSTGQYMNLGYNFDCEMDNIRMWNVVKTQAELQANMDKELTGAHAGLIGNYTFNEGTGTEAANHAASTYPAVLEGDADWAYNAGYTVGSYVWSTGATTSGITVTSADTYSVTVSTTDGCQAHSYLTAVNVNQPTASTQTISVCNGLSYSIGDSTYTASGIYTNMFTNAAGCDSTVTTNLTVQAPLNLTTTVLGSVISAANSAGTYQWINCSDNSHISGQTAVSYTATATGSYAAIITKNGCSDTTACNSVVITGLETFADNGLALTISPNPNNGSFIIKATGEMSYTIFSELGQAMQSGVLNDRNNYTVNMEHAANGIYYVIGYTGQTMIRQKIIVVK